MGGNVLPQSVDPRYATDFLGWKKFPRLLVFTGKMSLIADPWIWEKHYFLCTLVKWVEPTASTSYFVHFSASQIFHLFPDVSFLTAATRNRTYSCFVVNGYFVFRVYKHIPEFAVWLEHDVEHTVFSKDPLQLLGNPLYLCVLASQTNKKSPELISREDSK